MFFFSIFPPEWIMFHSFFCSSSSHLHEIFFHHFSRAEAFSNELTTEWCRKKSIQCQFVSCSIYRLEKSFFTQHSTNLSAKEFWTTFMILLEKDVNWAHFLIHKSIRNFCNGFKSFFLVCNFFPLFNLRGKLLTWKI